MADNQGQAAGNAADDLQFEVAEPVQSGTAAGTTQAARPAGMQCASCKAPVRDVYWGLRGHGVCTACKEKLSAALTGKGEGAPNVPQILTGLAFGLGAAIVGALAWGAISAATGYNLGLVAVLVGWLVGTAVRKGAKERRGVGLGIMAMVLVYLSVGTSELAYFFMSGHLKGDISALLSNPRLLLLIVRVPVLEAMGGDIIGVAINSFAIWQAWKMTRPIKLPFTGPHTITPGVATPVSTGT
jgi:hypothetical protein